MPVKRGAKAQETIIELSRQVAELQLALRQQSTLLASSSRYVTPHASFECGFTLGDVLSLQFSSAGIVRNNIPEVWMIGMDSLMSLFRQYNNMASNVPFALCVNVSDMLHTIPESPVLTLAALLVSPSLEPHVAKQLDFTFHRVLADQAMLQGKQNFDILGGLVTYLLWFHHRYDPETQQFFQYLQLAKAMIEDLQIRRCLEPGINSISGVSRLSVARILAGLFYVDQGTSMLDTERRRSPMSIDEVRSASIIVSNSQERLIDVDAQRIVDLLSCGAMSTELIVDGTETSTTQKPPSPCPCCVTIQQFFDTWNSLQHVTQSSFLLCPQEHYVIAAKKIQIFTDHVCRRPPGYLRSMTLVEWAYLLAVLVKLPYLEGCAPERLSGHTKMVVDTMKSHLSEALQANAQLYQKSSHLWWLEGIIGDAVSIVATQQESLESYRLLTTSTYELLERLTERICGFRKGIKIAVRPNPDSQVPEDADEEGFDQILRLWVHLDQT